MRRELWICVYARLSFGQLVHCFTQAPLLRHYLAYTSTTMTVLTDHLYYASLG